DELGQPPDRGRDLLQPPEVLGVPAVLGVPYGLGQQLVAGLEVVDDQSRARAGALGHVGDPGIGVAALHDDVQRRPQHLRAALLPGRVPRARSPARARLPPARVRGASPLARALRTLLHPMLAPASRSRTDPASPALWVIVAA